MVDISGALKNPGASFPFQEALQFEPCEVMGEELRFKDAVLEGELFGAEAASTAKSWPSLFLYRR